MLQSNLDDTITAISTPIGQGGIGILRLSGKCALAIADKIFVSKEGSKPSSYQTYTVHYGWIVSGHKPQATSHRSDIKNMRPAACNMRQDIIDEVLLTVMRAPGSYTKEDIVEINCHSGIVGLRGILDIVLSHGARLAQAGEFTKRAFLNGRIDLSKAEAVLDVINAKTGLGLESGMQQLSGRLFEEIKALKDKLLDVIALLEANIDFPDEDITQADREKVQNTIRYVTKRVDNIVGSSRHGKILREGISAVIVGKANVGKSSLLNALLREERAIVSPIPGTTRDAIEEIFDLEGIPLKIADTAGIMEPRDLIEKEALKRTKSYFEKANLVLLVFDAHQPLAHQDKLLIRKAKSKKVIAVLNKCDLRERIDREEIKKHFSPIVEISALKNKGLKNLEKAIVETIWEGNVNAQEEILVTNARHIQALQEARHVLEDASISLQQGLSLEFIALDMKRCHSILARITGETVEEDILDKIFSQFCVGK